MVDGDGREIAPPSDEEALDFYSMVAASAKYSKSQQSKFVKKMSKVVLPPSTSRKKSLALNERGLIGQSTCIFPSPKTMSFWLEKNWKSLIKGSLNHFFCGRGFFTFLFECEDIHLIFWSDPYFLGVRKNYLNEWTTEFHPKNEIPYVVLVWVQLPHLPLHCWNDGALRIIGNSISCYIDKE